jgi:hypothetical protein
MTETERAPVETVVKAWLGVEAGQGKGYRLIQKQQFDPLQNP